MGSVKMTCPKKHASFNTLFYTVHCFPAAGDGKMANLFLQCIACSLVIKHVTILLSANNLKLRRTTQQKNVLMSGSR